VSDTLNQPKRIIWAFALGYLIFYVAYAGLIKAVTSGLLGAEAKVSGRALLPAVLLSTIITLLLIITALGWWKYAPRPDRTLLISGFGTAMIIATTTIAYSFDGVSIVLALLLLRAGVLILAPIVDLACGRAVRWFCWSALGLSLLAVGIALAQVHEYRLSVVAIVNIALYIFGYSLRLPAMTRAAKVHDVARTRRYFVGELLVACAGLAITALALLAAGGTLRTPALPHAVGIGALYACLYLFGTLIYLDRRENTFCIPLNRCSSMLAGLIASWGLSRALGMAPVSGAQILAAGLVIAALALLSPAHHLAEVARDAGGVLKTAGRKQGLP
jgi:hypothetical protein